MAEGNPILPPGLFLTEPGEPVEPWSQWSDRLIAYIYATGLMDQPDNIKREILLNCLGLEGHRVFSTLEAGPSFKDAIEKLTEHFEPPDTSSERFPERTERESWNCVHCVSRACASFFSSICRLIREGSWHEHGPQLPAENKNTSTEPAVGMIAVLETQPLPRRSSVRPWYEP